MRPDSVVRVNPPDNVNVRIDGFHALKHALRFGAAVFGAMTSDLPKLLEMARVLAPDLLGWIDLHVIEVPLQVLRAQTDQLHSSNVVAWAAKPAYSAPPPGPAVLLEDPRHLGNLGAAIRVAAAAGAAGLATIGASDPWHPVAVRTSAGLHFALPVTRFDSIDNVAQTFDRPLIGVDPDGEDLRTITIPASVVLCFGTERAGLSADLLARCAQSVRLPMRPGVSSLNLATSVAVTLYHVALSRGGVGLV